MDAIGLRESICEPKARAMDGLSAIVLWVTPICVFICDICKCVIHVYEEDVQMMRMLCVVDINYEYIWIFIWWDVD